MRNYMILLPLLAFVQGYNYDASNNFGETSIVKQNLERSAFTQIRDVHHGSALTHITEVHLPPMAHDVIHKEIFSFSPSEMESIEDVLDVPNSKPLLMRRFNIIFIRFPDFSEDLTKAIANSITSRAEEKTIIYVFNKQTDINVLAKKFQDLTEQSPSRPEVHFVKYRNDAEAMSAMRSIQTQYESLGGITQLHRPEFAPVINFSPQRAV